MIEVDPNCGCGKVVLNGGGVRSRRREVVGLDWREDCPVHGIGTEWYETEGKAKMDETRQRSIDLQRQAREARRKATEERRAGQRGS